MHCLPQSLKSTFSIGIRSGLEGACELQDEEKNFKNMLILAFEIIVQLFVHTFVLDALFDSYVFSLLYVGF